jgi:hypothetical protein
MFVPRVYERAIVLGPEMELRVRGAHGGVEWVQVAEHLTIGRSAASDLVIEEEGVNLIHARVVAGVGGNHELRCVGMAKVVLSDGTCVDRLDLAPGVTFGVGAATVECVRLGKVVEGDVTSSQQGADESPVKSWNVVNAGDVKSQMSNVKSGEESAVAAVEMPRLVVCPTCYLDMTGVPSVARFCPKCGVQLPARDAAGFLIPPEESSPLYPVYHALREELGARLADETPQVASSLIILAYANAMLNLGWRYEHGRGAMRNVEEAARCYAKAGKLAEAWGR